MLDWAKLKGFVDYFLKTFEYGLMEGRNQGVGVRGRQLGKTLDNNGRTWWGCKRGDNRVGDNCECHGENLLVSKSPVPHLLLTDVNLLIPLHVLAFVHLDSVRQSAELLMSKNVTK
jgi:hypothetical protein